MKPLSQVRPRSGSAETSAPPRLRCLRHLLPTSSARYTNARNQEGPQGYLAGLMRWLRPVGGCVSGSSAVLRVAAAVAVAAPWRVRVRQVSWEVAKDRPEELESLCQMGRGCPALQLHAGCGIA